MLAIVLFGIGAVGICLAMYHLYLYRVWADLARNLP